MARSAVEGGFVPPPYPHDRLGDLQEVAASVPGGLVDASVGTPVDPTPDFVLDAARRALERSMGYPASIGAVELREAAARWIGRRFGVTVGPDDITASVGTKEAVSLLPRLLSLRDPGRDTVLYPGLSYPSYEMGAVLAHLRAVRVPVDDELRPDVSRVDPDDARRALLLWCNDPANPTGVGATREQLAQTVEWARGHGIVVASDECYAEFTYDEDGAPTDPVTALDAGPDDVLAVHSLSKRSNMAGFRVGFYAGDRELVRYLGDVRKHLGLMVPTAMQAAGVAALDDDAHVVDQRVRYARRRATLLPALERIGLVHDGGPSAFYLWLRDRDADVDGWELAARLARAGVLVAPGDLYGPDGAHHVRLALTLTDEQVERVASNVVVLEEGS